MVQDKSVSVLREAFSDIIIKRVNAGDVDGLLDLVVIFGALLGSSDAPLGGFIKRNALHQIAVTIATSLGKRGLGGEDWKNKSKQKLFLEAFKEVAEKTRKT